MDDTGGLICKRCHQPVEVRRAEYDVFEQMHWLCFHLEYEHDTDPDEPCHAPGCPWSIIRIYQQKLKELGLDPEQVYRDGLVKRWSELP